MHKLLNIRPEELPRFLYLYVMFFLGITGFIWGNMIVTAAFLQQVGVQALPYAMMINAVVSIVLIVVYSAFADRISNAVLLIAILGLSGLGIVLGLVALRQEQVSLAYALLYMIIRVPLQAIFNVHWATYVNGFYDTRAAKRIIPILGSGVRFASIVAGATIPLLNRLLPAEGVIAIWLGAVVLMAVMAALMETVLGRGQQATGLPTPAPTLAGEKAGLSRTFRNIREGYGYVTGSQFLRWLAFATLAMMILVAFIDYQTGKVMLDRLGTTQAIANFTGVLSAISNVIILPFQLFVLSRLIGWMGLGNASLIYPLTTLVTSMGLLTVPSIPAAALGYLNGATFRTLFYNPVNNLLYNAVPLRVKGRARAFIGGFVVPVGSLLGGLLLLLPQSVSALPPWLFPAIIVAMTLAYVAGMWATRRRYTEALIDMLEQEDFSFLLSQDASEVMVADAATLDKLKRELAASKSHEFTAFMAKLITQIGGAQAVPILSAAVLETEDGRTRVAILNVLLAADLRGEGVVQLYMEGLEDGDGRVREAAIAGLAQGTGAWDAQARQRVVEMVDDPEVPVRVQALLALIQNGGLSRLEPGRRARANQALAQLLESDDPEERAAGVRLLGEIDNAEALRHIMTHLEDLADRVRLEAVLALEARTATPDRRDEIRHAVSVIHEMETALVALLNDPVERARQGALTILGRIGSKTSYEALTAALGDPSPVVRATAVDALVSKGKGAIPTVHARLKSPNVQVRNMAMVTLSRINPKEYGPLIVAELVHGNLMAIYRHLGQASALAPCAPYPSGALLRTALGEESRRLSDEIFYFLSALHDPAALQIIQASLKSDNARARANATEALEALTTPQTACLIAPLFDPETLGGGLAAGDEADVTPLLALGRDTWEMEPPATGEALRKLAGPETPAWFRALTVAALGEMKAAYAPPPPEEPKPPASPTRRAASALDALLAPDDQDAKPAGGRGRRRGTASPLDLLGKLVDEGPQAGPTHQAGPTRQAGSEETGETDDRSKPAPASAPTPPLTELEIESLLAQIEDGAPLVVREALHAAGRAAPGAAQGQHHEEAVMLSTIEKIIFLKEVPFFQGMTIDQLRVLANVCEEEMFEEDATIYSKDDPGGVLYVVVNGRVGVEQEKRTGSARLATIGAYSYFGEMNLFDNSPRTTSAVAIQDTLTLKLRREPLIALARQHPELSLELINVLSERLREANSRVAELTRSRPRELHKLFDKFD